MRTGACFSALTAVSPANPPPTTTTPGRLSPASWVSRALIVRPSADCGRRLSSPRRRGGRDGGPCWWLVVGAKRLHEGHERGHLGRGEVLPVCRHVPAPLQDLTDQLIPRLAG